MKLEPPHITWQGWRALEKMKMTMTHLWAKEGEAPFCWWLLLNWPNSPSPSFHQLQIKVSYVKHKSWAATLFSSREQSLSKNNVQTLTTGAGPHKIRSFGAAPYTCSGWTNHPCHPPWGWLHKIRLQPNWFHPILILFFQSPRCCGFDGFGVIGLSN